MQSEIRDRQMASDTLPSQWLWLARACHEAHCFALKELISMKIELGGSPKKATRNMNNYMASTAAAGRGGE